MANLEKVSTGAASDPKPSLVGVNLTTAGHLAAALARAGRALQEEAAAVRRAAAAAGTVAGPAARLEQVAAWADAQSAAMRGLVARLAAADAPGPTLWWGAEGPAFADPTAAHALGTRVAAALLAGDLGLARRLLAGRAHDPVVATVVTGLLGADGVVSLLRPAVHVWARDDGDAAELRATVDLVASSLAAATRAGTARIGMADLAQAATGASVPLLALGLLFAGGARFSTSFLREAVTAVVVPINRQVRENPGRSPQAWLIPARDRPLDARVLVVRAAARDHHTAMEALGVADLDDLLPGTLAYGDRGEALALLLARATTPLDGHGAPLTDPLVTTSPVRAARQADNARRVIEWVGRNQDVPPLVHAGLGGLARPWIGSLRSDGLDAVVRRHVPVDEGLARSFLTYAQARDDVTEALQDAAWTWAATEVDRLADRHPAAGFDAVGSVLGLVTVTGLDADARRSADRDRRTARQNALWHRLVAVTTGRLPGPARAVVGPAVRRGLDEVLDDADHELTHWRDLRDLAVAHEHLALDHLVTEALVRRRGGLPDPPPEVLVDPHDAGAGLRHPLTLDEAGVRAWTAWRSSLAAAGVPARQLAGDQFLAETRE